MIEHLDAAAIAARAIAILESEGAVGEFKLRSLFRREEWEELDVVERRLAGKIFKRQMGHRPDATSHGPNTANHQRYARKEYG